MNHKIERFMMWELLAIIAGLSVLAAGSLVLIAG